KHRLKLGIKQLVPNSIDEFLAEHKPGDLVSGRVVEVAGDRVLAELGEGIRATCRIAKPARQEHSESDQPGGDTRDVTYLSSMLARNCEVDTVGYEISVDRACSPTLRRVSGFCFCLLRSPELPSSSACRTRTTSPRKLGE